MKRRLITIALALVLSLVLFKTNAYADYYSDYTVLYKGIQNTEVVKLQNDLKRLGFFSGNSTGYFGSITQQAVIQFQKSNYLSVDGVVGHQTAKEIKVDMVIQTGKSYLGVPYVWGGVSPSGFDCSGFTHYAFLQSGIVIPRTAALQYNEGTWVSKSLLKPGDLVFFTTYKPGPSHVGIYIGSGKFIHASSGANAVTISELSNPYYTQHYIGAKRILK